MNKKEKKNSEKIKAETKEPAIQQAEQQAEQQEQITPQKLQPNFNRPVIISGRLHRSVASPIAGFVSSPVIS